MEVLHSYQNGNTSVTLHEDGTKIREYEGTPEIVHPESIDVKITNFCDLGCAYCHESSTTEGQHADLRTLLDVLKPLPAGVELAIGGGNPLSHPNLIPLLSELKHRRDLIANITINQGHLLSHRLLIKTLIENDLVKGIGISVTSKNFKHVLPIIERSNNVVFHVIAGVNDISILDKLMELGDYCKVLVLGYKRFGLGTSFYSDKVEARIKEWRNNLYKYVGKCTLSFDNLAIEQLNVRRLFTDKGWEKFYMGDDFCFTMYIDAVNKQYAPTSRSSNRESFNDYTLLEYFETRKKD